jgi:hypothetical protein
MRPDVAAAFDRLATAPARDGVALVITSAYAPIPSRLRICALHGKRYILDAPAPDVVRVGTSRGLDSCDCVRLGSPRGDWLRKEKRWDLYV